MNRVHPRLGSSGPPEDWSFDAARRRGRGFTLIEMLMVLLIIALLFGLAMPAMQSAFTEQAVRKDAHQLALMVKTAMIQSTEQHRTYVIDLSETSMALHPLGETAAPPDDANTASFDDTAQPATSGPVDVEMTTDLDPPNKLQTPDLLKVNTWDSVPDGTQWVFEPGELGKTTDVRIVRGNAWIELTFNALTGNVEKESNYLP